MFFLLIYPLVCVAGYSEYCIFAAIFYWIRNKPETDKVLAKKYIIRGIFLFILVSVLMTFYLYIAKYVFHGSGFLN